jgi:hypothetical protein
LGCRPACAFPRRMRMFTGSAVRHVVPEVNASYERTTPSTGSTSRASASISWLDSGAYHNKNDDRRRHSEQPMLETQPCRTGCGVVEDAFRRCEVLRLPVDSQKWYRRGLIVDQRGRNPPDFRHKATGFGPRRWARIARSSSRIVRARALSAASRHHCR